VISLYMVWSLLVKTPCGGWNSAKLSWNIDRVSLQQGRSWVWQGQSRRMWYTQQFKKK